MSKLFWIAVRKLWSSLSAKARLTSAAFLMGVIALFAALGSAAGWAFDAPDLMAWGAALGVVLALGMLGFMVWGEIAWERNAEGVSLWDYYKQGKL